MEKVVKFLVTLTVVVLVASCGGNLFKGLEQESKSKEEKIYEAKTALDQGDYPTAMSKLENELPENPTDCAKPENQEVCIIYAQAELGSAGFDIPTILSNAIDAINTNVSTVGNEVQNFQTVINVLKNLNRDKLESAVEKLNNAQITNSGEQLTAGIANAACATLTILDTFDANSDGKLDSNVNISNAWDNIDDKVINYATTGVDFVTKALTGTNETTQDLKDAINDVDAKIKDYTQRKNTLTEEDIKNLLGLQ